MKLFRYAYNIPYGEGCGVVIAKTKEDAIKMIQLKPYDSALDDLEVEEVNMKISQQIDHSWCE